MTNFRLYGSPPFSIAVIHGGPGAPGQVAPMARELGKKRGIIEPLQSASTLNGQVEELEDQLNRAGETPFVLIGSSWGAMLAYIFTARHPCRIRELILVGSGVFQEQYAQEITAIRFARLEKEEQRKVTEINARLNDANIPFPEKNRLMAGMGEIFTRTDSFDPMTIDSEAIEVDYAVYHNVWKEAVELRKSGELLVMGKQIACPVLALHGDYDPHPAEGVEKPLRSVLKDFRFILLPECGHLPWIERQARDLFFSLIEEELSRLDS